METVESFIREKSVALFEKVKGYRNHMHQFPELSFKEFKTMEFVCDQLTLLGIPFSSPVAGTGVLAVIRGDHHHENQSCVGLRSELDALPIQEQNEVEYRSKNDGVMHACGHDVHTAILLGTAELLMEIRNELPHPVKLFFQPGEEKNPGGASLMIEAGALKNPPVHELFALHVFPEMEVGKIGFKEGLYMASCDEIHLTIHGKGGHGAMPHQTIDPIMIGAQLLTGLQQIVSRNCDPKIPCVLSFGHFEALGATNIIPEKAILKGTFRTMNEEWRSKALKLIEQHIQSTCSQFGAKAELDISKGYPFLENDPELTKRLRKTAISFFGDSKVDELPIRLTSEDFSFYAQHLPVCFFRLGVSSKNDSNQFGVHHPKFNIDEEAMFVGVQAMALACFS